MVAKDKGFVYVARQVDDRRSAEQIAALELAGVTSTPRTGGCCPAARPAAA